MSIYYMQNTLKKLGLQYAYLSIEKEEIYNACLEVESEMQSYILEHYPKYSETCFNERPTGSNKVLEDKGINKTKHKNKDLKKLYRKIAAKIHPDKCNKKQSADLFAEAAEAYEDGNLAKMLEIAATINLDVPNISEESILLLEKNVKNILEEINIKKKTTAWAWCNAKSEEEKIVIVKNILISRGVKL